VKAIDQGSVPNFFYDLIVFVSPSVLFLVGMSIGFLNGSLDLIKHIGSDVGAIDYVCIAFLILFLSYEYGRALEALSHVMVTRVFRLLRSARITRGLFRNSDFDLSFETQIEQLQLPLSLPERKKDNKWTIYFFALLYVPHIGRDLLKRYAWEKLARSSALTFGILSIISFVVIVLELLSVHLSATGRYGFGSLLYTFSSILLTVLTYYEFYLRKCWNNDLLAKVIPILKAASQVGFTGEARDADD